MPDIELIDGDVLNDSYIEKVAAVAGCIDLISYGGCTIKACWTVRNDSIEVVATLETPVGDVDLGKVTLTPNNASVKIGGGKRGFKAEFEFSVNFGNFTLKICGKVSTPFGSKRGCTTVNL